MEGSGNTIPVAYGAIQNGYEFARITSSVLIICLTLGSYVALLELSKTYECNLSPCFLVFCLGFLFNCDHRYRSNEVIE